MSAISSNYRRLEAHEVATIAAECANAWLNPDIPARQWELAVKPELEKYRRGEPVAPFDALARCLEHLPEELRWPSASLLDVGASAGYYREVLRQNSWHCDYTACDFSPAFKALAEKLYPLIKFDVADARELPYENGSFDVVANCAVLMHVLEYQQVITETARVAKQYAIFHRTPILTDSATSYWLKEAYGVPVLEVHYNESLLLQMLRHAGLRVIASEDVFFDNKAQFGHRTYLAEKVSSLDAMERQWERA